MRKILNVNKVKQKKYHCGPASLSMVLQYLGCEKKQEEIAEELERRILGFRDQDLINYARNYGFVAHPYSGFSIEGLLGLIDKTIAPIVRTKSLSDLECAHMLVVKGYDLEKKVLFINDPGYSNNYTISVHK